MNIIFSIFVYMLHINKCFSFFINVFYISKHEHWKNNFSLQKLFTRVLCGGAFIVDWTGSQQLFCYSVYFCLWSVSVLHHCSESVLHCQEVTLSKDCLKVGTWFRVGRVRAEIRHFSCDGWLWIIIMSQGMQILICYNYSLPPY